MELEADVVVQFLGGELLAQAVGELVGEFLFEVVEVDLRLSSELQELRIECVIIASITETQLPERDTRLAALVTIKEGFREDVGRRVHRAELERALFRTRG